MMIITTINIMPVYCCLVYRMLRHRERCY